MRAKEYFQQIALIEKKLKVLQAKLRHFEDLGLTITSNTSAVGGHQAGTSRVELASVGKVDAERDLRTRIDAYLQQVSEAETIIDQIHAEKYRQILTYRYLCGWSFSSISDELRYKDPKSIYRAHGWALAEAQRIIDARFPTI